MGIKTKTMLTVQTYFRWCSYLEGYSSESTKLKREVLGNRFKQYAEKTLKRSGANATGCK